MSTIEQYKEAFIQAVKDTNTETNPEQKGSDWDVFGTAQGVIASQQASDIQNTENAAFIQNQSGSQLTLSGFSRGILPQQGATPANCVITNTILPVSSFTLNEGETFTSDDNGAVYTLISRTFVSSASVTPLSLQSQKLGAGLSVATGSTFQNTATQGLGYATTSSNDGQDAEGEDAFRKRVLTGVQLPTGAGREGDFVRWAFEGAPDSVTDVDTIPFFQSQSGGIGVFILGGSQDFNTILLSPTEYNRTLSPAVVTNVRNYINVQKGIQQQAIVSSVSTFLPTQIIELQVRLKEGITLTTVLPNFNGDDISVENLILQEFRRALITYPTGGTVNDNETGTFLLLSRIEQTLDSSLSVFSGIYAQIIVDRVILVNAAVQNILVPFKTVDVNQNLVAIYDIATALTSVTLL